MFPYNFLVFGCLLINIAGCAAYDSANREDPQTSGIVQATAAYSASADGRTVLIDVREPNEIERGAPEKAAAQIVYRLNHSQDAKFVNGTSAAVAGNRSTSITLICATGVRSAAARDLLRQHGFTNVKSLDGGFRAWQTAQLPVR